MQHHSKRRSGRLALGILLGCQTLQLAAAPADEAIEEVVVWSSTAPRHRGPLQRLTPQDLASATIVTSEDLVKYEPGVIVRRRFVGDANGTLGLRGANMFQTSRSLVFADGVPLHYHLQSRWDGAPRWSMIAASEIARVDVLYGPFAAEYSGSAMGGVILMESAIPQQREIHFDSMAFVQDFSAYGFDDALRGHKTFLSLGDKFGDTSVYLSWNRLQNDAQPQTFYFGGAPGKGEAQSVTGAIAGNNERSQRGMWFGDTGVIGNRTDNLKLKLGHAFDDWDALLNLAWEGRDTQASPNNYLRDATGAPVWSGTLQQDGQRFSVPASRFGVGEGERESLSAGLRLKGSVGDIALESNLNWFGVLRDEYAQSARHPQDPAWTPAGQLTRFGNTGWRTAELKASMDIAAVDGLQLVTGLRHEDFELARDVYASNDYRRGSRTRYSDRSGGSTAIDAVFAQLRWDLSERWDAGFGLRHERWSSQDGYYGKDQVQTPAFDLVQLPARSASKTSPKFSLGFAPDDVWSLRYSAARAWRFPIVEELFSQYQAYNAVNQANPQLAPENGIHHNLGITRSLADGELQLNLFQERVRDVIEAQATTLPGGLSLRTFLPVGEVRTRGAELTFNRNDLLLAGLDLRFNLAWTDARIMRNAPDPALVGKQYPRMPRLRANLLLNYRLSRTLDVGTGIRHASDSYGLLDNSDREQGVYGAQDGYTFVNLKANWKASDTLQLGLGIENLFNDVAYVAHPWPARTLFLELGVRL